MNTDSDDDVISYDTGDHDIQHTILQVLLSLSTIQMEHEMVQRGVNKCYSTVKQIMQLVNNQVSGTENQDFTAEMYSNVPSLYSQLKALKGLAQRCASSTKAQMESIAGYLGENQRKERYRRPR